jgi:hypothetical protein
MTRPVFVLCLLLATPWTPARAQHPPLTARTDMPAAAPQPAAPEPPLPPAAAGVPPHRSSIGDTTRALLRLQAGGTQAAALPTSGSGRSGR